MEIFNLGDVVKLKSGSPDMVIEQIISTDRVTCTWLNDKQSQEIGNFNTFTLELVKAKKS